MHTLTFDEAGEYLDEVADGIPEEIFRELNGGIVMLPDVVVSPHAVGNDLYTLGMYHYEPYGMGRYISIYYGSFVKVHGNKPTVQQKKALKDVLYHELTHHLENMAGMRDLDLEDEVFIENFTRAREEKNPPKPDKPEK